MEVPEEWLCTLTKEHLATACLQANFEALPKKASKEEWVQHAIGHVLLHHVDMHGLEKLCKHQKLEYQDKPRAQLIKLLQKHYTASAVQPDVFAAFGQLKISSAPEEKSPVSPSRLSALAPQRLQDLCRARVLPASGSKADMIHSLHHDDINLDELSKSELKALCAAEGLPVSGTCAALRARLESSQGPASNPASAPAKQQAVVEEQLKREAAVVQQGDLLQAGKKMVRTRAMQCHAMLCCAVLCNAMLFHALQGHARPYLYCASNYSSIRSTFDTKLIALCATYTSL